jgi:hypothetical protein
MRRPRVTVMQHDREIVPQRFIHRHRGFEQPLLDVARQIRPQLQSSAADEQCKFLVGMAHDVALSRVDVTIRRSVEA